MISILLVDDQRLVRAGFASILGDEDDMEVVAQASDGHQAVELARQLQPDVVLMDIRMPQLNGLDATREILGGDRCPQTKIIVLTTFDIDDYIYAALRAGASGFLVKDTDPDELVHAVRVVAAGEALMSPSITRRLISEFVSSTSQRRQRDPALNALTGRETEVLTLVGAGLSNDEIAGELFVSPATAKTHVSRVLSKLRARDRAQLVVIAYESGLITPGTGR
ncbi:response regulator transcription factor [Natronoglycomyces albus]|uniref:Response regulator transcription factor n=1 Tax=Natronoglycomyces albus TaxID=2811108 RepID=A0A895XKL4_9ACTN|nr:response regulator transcription factor [Natronoglycomyces albus]QSB04103.1 response regulator transcription factor [Natronoglycomyces albus]